MMSPKLVIHIGSPKTSTTSLQSLLESLDIEGFMYGGCLQPRSAKRPSLVSDIHRSIVNRDKDSIKELSDSIKVALESKEIVLLSEEMFLVHENRMGVKEKLQELYDLIGDLRTEVLITVRNPSKGLPSLYQELYSNLPKDLQEDFSKFCYSDYALSFRYPELDMLLKDLGFKNIRYVSFDSLVSGNLTLGSFLNSTLEQFNFALSLPKLNEGAKDITGRRQLVKSSRSKRLVKKLIKMKPSFLPNMGLSRKIPQGKDRSTSSVNIDFTIPPSIIEAHSVFSLKELSSE
ncbi:MAG: hypothetical protein HWE24_17295 [Oceanospirillaceae bacterium]|nr:hypothetical protein [Oceanospirillaceae bacterium]